MDRVQLLKDPPVANGSRARLVRLADSTTLDVWVWQVTVKGIDVFVYHGDRTTTKPVRLPLGVASPTGAGGARLVPL